MWKVRIGIWLNRSKPEALPIARRFVDMLLERDIKPLLPRYAAEELSLLKLSADDPADCDILAVFGGDGTILSAVPHAVRGGVPILGINLGRVGFLTEVEPSECDAAVDRLLSNDWEIEERMLLMARVPGNDYYALNDVVIARASYLQTVRIDLVVDGHALDPYIGDGVILASPTGSTAYALSAGGPLISPLLPCIQIAPICTSDLRVRPIVLPPDARVDICSDYAVNMFVDGMSAPLEPGQVVNVTKAVETVRFIRFKPTRFLELVHKKLTGRDN